MLRPNSDAILQSSTKLGGSVNLEQWSHCQQITASALCLNTTSLTLYPGPSWAELPHQTFLTTRNHEQKWVLPLGCFCQVFRQDHAKAVMGGGVSLSYCICSMLAQVGIFEIPRSPGSNRGREKQTTKSEAWIPQWTRCRESWSPRSLLLDLARPEGPTSLNSLQ